MKKAFLYWSLIAAFAAAIVSCGSKDPAPEPEPEPVAPKVIEEYLTANPEGQADLTITIAAEEAWTVAAEESYDWASVSPASGTGNATLTFTVTTNETDKERMAEFTVTEGKFPTYTIIITQAKKESNVNDSDLAFLKAVVEGQMLGEDTPTIENWYEVDAGAFPGINMIDKDGKFFIESLDGAPFTDLPTSMILPELTRINLRGQAGLTGKRMPKEWSTPKLTIINMSVCGLTGPIPAGLGETPVLNQIYLDQNHLFGALPHKWTSTCLEAVLLANINNKKAGTEYPQATTDNEGLGYIVPAALDVPLNQYNENGELNNPSRDKTQMKLGGVLDGNWLGFEEGWGQVRYEKYDAEAVKGDKTIWSEHRLLIDDWAWYFSNMGYTDMLVSIPHVLLKWDQAAADAYTAECETKYASK